MKNNQMRFEALDRISTIQTLMSSILVSDTEDEKGGYHSGLGEEARKQIAIAFTALCDAYMVQSDFVFEAGQDISCTQKQGEWAFEEEEEEEEKPNYKVMLVQNYAYGSDRIFILLNDEEVGTIINSWIRDAPEFHSNDKMFSILNSKHTYWFEEKVKELIGRRDIQFVYEEM